MGIQAGKRPGGSVLTMSIKVFIVSVLLAVAASGLLALVFLSERMLLTSDVIASLSVVLMSVITAAIIIMTDNPKYDET